LTVTVTVRLAPGASVPFVGATVNQVTLGAARQVKAASPVFVMV
jgi:hypothetical protein